MDDHESPTNEPTRRPIPVRVALGRAAAQAPRPPASDARAPAAGAAAAAEPAPAAEPVPSADPAPAADAAGGGDAGPSGRNREAGEGSGGAPARRRPTPVREALGQAVPAREPAAPPDEERHFRVDGTEWIARIGGRTLYGTGSTPRARLMTIDFCRADEPDKPVSRLLVPGSTLDGVYDEELCSMLAHAEVAEEKARQMTEDRRRVNRRRRRPARERGR